MYKHFFKRFFDFFFAVTLFICIFPILFIVTLVLFVSNGGSPLFFQQRPGRGGRIFRIVKFKTMNDKRGDNGELLSDAKRLTKVGRFVRSTSLDELPQLINVIKGDMSFIGPRPLLIQYLTLYTPEQARRHDVRPGITGWAQVNGRNAILWEQKFKLDVFYVDNLSIALDINVIILTIKKVICRSDINSATSATMEPFKGIKGR